MLVQNASPWNNDIFDFVKKHLNLFNDYLQLQAETLDESTL